MVTLKCTKCGKSFTKETKVHASQALHMHNARTHDHTIVGPRERGVAVSSNGHSGVRGAYVPPAVKAKRAPRAPVSISVDYCAHCGTPIHAIASALVALGKHIHLNFCPGCGTDQRDVAAAIATAEKLA